MTRTISSRAQLTTSCAGVALLSLVACSAQTSTLSPPLSANTDRSTRDEVRNRPSSSQQAAQGSPFDGEWSVAWCNESKPDMECGGFNLSLVQNGSRLCGAYDSARVGLTQVDQGGRVLGTAENGNAALTIQSERSGGQYAAVASIDQGRIRWKLGETMQKAGQDIDIIAIDEMLDRRPLEGDVAQKHKQIALDCQAHWNKG